jgi:chemotaxis protein CheD
VARSPSSPPGAPGDARLPDLDGRAQRYLHAGEVAVAARPTAMVTVLGSCVAVCLHDPASGVGGVNHFLLPHHVERERSARFGTVAIPELVAAALRAGASRAGLVAKVFGGAGVLGGSSRGRRLGEENAALALRLLAEAGIPVLDHDVGGVRGRKLVFLTDAGTAWVRHL